MGKGIHARRDIGDRWKYFADIGEDGELALTWSQTKEGRNMN